MSPEKCGATFEGFTCELPFLHDGWHACVEGDVLRKWLDPVIADENGEAKIRIPYE